MNERHREIKKTLIVVLFLNLAVAVAKAVFGVLANSLAMIADAVHSLFDSSSNIIGLVAVNRACKPPDADHPYGHRKYEVFAALMIAFLLVVTAFEIVEGVIKRLLNPTVPYLTPATYAVMVATIIVNFFVSRYEHGRGKDLHSDVLVADSLHTRSDVYASLAVLAGFLAVRAGYPTVDAVVALVIVALIARTAWRIIHGSSEVLCDTAVLDEKEIEKLVKSVKGVRGCHRIRTRGSPESVFLDLHIKVDPKVSIKEAHELSHRVEDKIRGSFEHVVDVVVHIEPGGTLK